MYDFTLGWIGQLSMGGSIAAHIFLLVLLGTLCSELLLIHPEFLKPKKVLFLTNIKLCIVADIFLSLAITLHYFFGIKSLLPIANVLGIIIFAVILILCALCVKNLLAYLFLIVVNFLFGYFLLFVVLAICGAGMFFILLIAVLAFIIINKLSD